jgi:hypothetical protein
MSFTYLIFLIIAFSAFAAGPIKRVAIISDMNNSYGSTTYGKEVSRAITKLKEINPDLVLSTGDMVAGQKAGLDYQAMWNSFHEIVTLPLANANIPFAVTVGNHDGSGYPKFKNEREIFSHEWTKYKPKLVFSSDEHYPLFYSFELGDILFLSIDSTMVGPLALLQLNFLDSELSRHADKTFKVIFTHVPMFQFNQSGPNESFFDQILFGLLQKHGVQLYLTGHHHAYYPGFYQGMHFVSQACLGAGAEKLIGMATPSPRSMTMIDFYEDHFQIYALEAPDFEKVINHNQLPPKIVSKNLSLILKDHFVKILSEEKKKPRHSPGFELP